jgi:hypothetical protein
MTKIFGRDDKELSIYELALSEWKDKDKGELGQKELAVNLIYDNRVNKAREKMFRTYFSAPYDGRKLKEAVIDYHRDRVQDIFGEPDFCMPECNNTIVDTTQGICCRLFKKGTYLVNILNLNSLNIVLDNVSEKYPYWKNFFPEDRSPIKFSRWLNANLLGKDPKSNEVKNFISNILGMLNSNIRDAPRNPVWVTTWESFENYALLSQVDRWNQLVGVPSRKGSWQIVLKYPAEEVGCIHRPTQLDSGYYFYHFPLPIEVLNQTDSISHSGHTMDLQKGSFEPLLPEFIHTQIEIKLDYWIDSGSLIKQTKYGRDYTISLNDFRSRHYQKLQASYGKEFIENWMPNP